MLYKIIKKWNLFFESENSGLHKNTLNKERCEDVNYSIIYAVI